MRTEICNAAGPAATEPALYAVTLWSILARS